MKIDPRRLLDLLMVARHGSFSGAAVATRISQPALSKSIGLLERELGARVLERDRQGARLNEFGTALARHAQALESLLAQSKEEMRLRLLGIEGPLAIGITPVTAVGLVPQALELLTRETPNISVSVIEGLDNEIKSMLRSRELDLVVSRLGVGPEYTDIEEDPLILAGWSLITRPGHRLADLPSVSIKALGDVQWVLPAGGSAFRQQMEVVFTSAGLWWPSRGISTNSILAIKAIVMNTDCVTIMSPRLVEVERSAGRLCSVSLTDVSALRPVGLMWRRGEELSPIATRFAKVLRSVAREDPDRIADLA
jgi:DNA-binding transcriptional LysR family regulator